MAVLDRSGVKLSLEEAGSGDPPIVFVHGWTCNHTYFSPQFEHFKARHRVVAVDLRGHGASDAPEGDYPIPLMADDVAWICGELGLEGVVLVGHSMGAAVVVDAAARHPGLASRLVLVDGAPISTPAEVASALAPFLEALRGPGAEAARRHFVDTLLFLPSDDPAVKARVVEEMMAPPDRVARACFEGLGGWEGAAALRAVTVPVLAIHAENPLNPPDRLVALNPGLVNVTTPGVGHFNQLLAPDEVNRLIAEFLAG